MVFFESIYLNIFIVLSVCVTCLYFYSARKFNHWKNKGVAFKKPLPIFGNFKNVILMQEWLSIAIQEIYNLFPNEKFFGVFHFSRPTLIVRDPDLIKQMLVRDFQHFTDRNANKEKDEDPLRRSLVHLHGSRWKQLRHKLTPVFSSGKLKAMWHLLVECGENFENLLHKTVDDSQPVEMKDLCAQYTLQVIGSVSFGINKPDSKFREMGRKLFESDAIVRLKSYFKVAFPKLTKFMGIRITPMYIEDFFIGVVKQVLDHRRKNNIKRSDFIQLLIQLQDSEYIDNKSEKDDTFVFDDVLLAAQVFIFFTAGFESSSTVMSYVLYELALNPDIERKVQQEIDEVLQKYDGILTYDGVQELKYLNQVIAEGLRKYPPAGHLIRICTLPYIIPETNVSLNVGDLIHFPTYALHHDPQYYSNPSKFDPERFSDENKSKIHPFTYLPFGEGPRRCIAIRFSKLQVIVGLTSFLKKFSVSCCPKTDLSLKFDSKSMVPLPTNGLWLDVKRRS